MIGVDGMLRRTFLSSSLSVTAPCAERYPNTTALCHERSRARMSVWGVCGGVVGVERENVSVRA